MLADFGVRELVGALETLPSPPVLAQIVSALGAERVVFSLYLKAGCPLGDSTSWPQEPRAIAQSAIEAGVRRILLLDHVGRRAGPERLEICREPVDAFPQCRWLTGGGINGRSNVRALEAVGIQGVLTASAFHDGSWLSRISHQLPAASP